MNIRRSLQKFQQVLVYGGPFSSINPAEMNKELGGDTTPSESFTVMLLMTILLSLDRPRK